MIIKKNHFSYLNIVVFLITFIATIAVRYTRFDELWYDSPAFLNNSVFVSPFYPMILDVLQFLFGENNLFLIALTQLTIGFIIVFISCMVIADIAEFKDEARFIFTLFLLNSYGSLGYNIMTEALAIPVFYLYTAFLLLLFKERKFSDFYKLNSIALVTCLIRPQLLVLFGITFLVLMVLIYLEKVRWLKFKTFFCYIFCLTIFFTFVPVYNFIVKGRMVGFQQGGISLIITPAYTAKPEQANLFKDDLTKEIFAKSVEKMQKFNALMYCDKSKWKLPTESEYIKNIRNFDNWSLEQHTGNYALTKDHFERAAVGQYNIGTDENGNCKIIDRFHNGNSAYARNDAFLDSFAEKGIYDWEKINPVLADIANTLRNNNFKDWLLACWLNFKSNMGFSGSVIWLIFALRFTYLYRLKKSKKYKFNYFDLLIAFAMAFHLLNAIYVSLLTFYVPRYQNYSITIFISILIVFVVNYVSKLVNRKLAK